MHKETKDLLLIIALFIVAAVASLFFMSGEPKMIIESDGGYDDVLALAVLAHHAPEELGMIVSSYGSGSLDDAVRANLAACETFGIDVPVLKGAAQPAEAPPARITRETAADFLPAAHRTAADGDAVDAVYQFAKKHGKIDYVALGPLTTLAQVLERYPDFPRYVRKVTFSGAAISEFDVNDCAEFNVYCDAVSAARVFDAGMFTQVLVNEIAVANAFDRSEVLHATDAGTPQAEAARALLFASEAQNCTLGRDGADVSDVIAALYNIRPSYYAKRGWAATALSVTTSGAAYGQTVRDHHLMNIRYPTVVVKPFFVSMLREALQ